MNKFKLLLVILFCPLFLFSQTIPKDIGVYRYERNSIIYEFLYSPCLKSMLDDYFGNKGLNRMDLEELCSLKGVFHSKINGEYAGAFGVNAPIVDSTNKFIYINDHIKDFLPTFITAVLYHEMFHQLLPTVKHCTGNRCPYIFKNGDGINIENVIKTFDEYEKDRYFKHLYLLQKQVNN